MRERNESNEGAELPDEVVVGKHLPTPIMPPMPAPNRDRHEALAAIEREAKALLGSRLRSLPRLIAELRAML